VAKTAFFAKIYTSRLRLLTGATFQNFLTLITCFSPTYFIWCRRDAKYKIHGRVRMIFIFSFKTSLIGVMSKVAIVFRDKNKKAFKRLREKEMWK
jgi:hypothetical protein